MQQRRACYRSSIVPLLATLAVVVAACGAAGTPGSTPQATPAPAASRSPAASPTPGATIDREGAIARVLAQDPRFSGIGPLDPDLIGQSAWYEVSPGVVGWRVVVTMGWGDCQAGCISRHTWTYDVDPSGSVTLVDESGDPLPDDSGGVPASPPVAIPSDGGPWIAGRAVAGPTCPVVQNPPDPSCADRPVAGAIVVVRDRNGAQVGRATTAADGTFLVAVPGGGSYVVEAEPVEGVIGTPTALDVQVGDGASSWTGAVLAYDTGIR
jgi:hypothetical protein